MYQRSLSKTGVAVDHLDLVAAARYAQLVKRVAMLSASLVLACGAADARGAIVVNTFTDESVSGDGHCSLREAITAANTHASSGDCGAAAATGTTAIQLKAGTYQLTPGTGLLFGGAASVAIQGASSDPTQTIIDGGDDFTHRGRVVFVTLAARVALAGVEIRGGWTADGITGQFGMNTSGGQGSPGVSGAGIANDGTLTAANVLITQNRTGAGGSGGGCTGLCTGGAGGTGGAGSGIANFGTFTGTATKIAGNVTGTGGRGGGNPALVGGNGGNGGAGGGVENAGTVTLADVVVSANSTGGGGDVGPGLVTGQVGGAGGSGGGISNEATGKLTASSTTIAANNVGAGVQPSGIGAPGGGIFATSSGTLQLTSSTVSANNAGNGGDGSLFSSAGGPGGAGGGIFDSGVGTLTNDTIAGNSAGTGGSGATGAGGDGGNGGAGGSGGGIDYLNPGSLSLTAVTITQNANGRPGTGGKGIGSGTNGATGPSAVGGAIEDAGSSLTEASTLIATNSRPMCAGAVGDGSDNLAFPDSEASCPGIHADPMLGTLASKGGLVQTAALRAGSAAIDAVPVGAGCPPTDARGVARPQPAGGRCDIGAYEFAPPVCSVVTASTSSGAPVTVRLSCTDIAGAPLIYALDAGPAHGSLSGFDSVGGRVTYTPAAHFAGTDRFGFHAANGNGIAASQIATVTVTSRPSAPVLTRLRISPRAFPDVVRRARHRRRRRTGARISYVDSQAATTTFTVLALRRGVLSKAGCVRPPRHPHKRAKHCVRYVAVGVFRRADRGGSTSFHFSGVVGRRALSTGRYRLSARPALGGLAGAAVTVGFRITP